MEQKKVTRDFKVLAEKISPDNVAVMAELIAMKETKILISYLGHHAGTYCNERDQNTHKLSGTPCGEGA